MIKIINISFVLLLSWSLFSCTKKDEPKPIQQDGQQEVKVTKLDLTSDIINFDTIVKSTRKLDVFLFAKITNITTGSAKAEDNTFVWELVSSVQPKDWKISMCIGGECHPPEVTNGEFVLEKDSTQSYDFVINSISPETNKPQELGESYTTAQYVIYRKGLKKEDGLFINLKVTAAL